MKQIFAAVCLVVFLAVAAGCNTMRGMGKDIKGAGKAIEEAAD